MTFSDAPPPAQMWHFVTRLGEAELLLPAAGLTVLVLMVRGKTRKLALSWIALVTLATVITLGSKIAFMGWGMGWAALDFTGVSGHAMFAAAIYPVLVVTFAAGDSQSSYRLCTALGWTLALLVGVSRVIVGAHSVSEVVIGLAIGGAASALALARNETSVTPFRHLAPAVLLAWVAVMPFKLPPSQTHSFVTRVALDLSGRDAPFTRSAMMRRGLPSVLHNTPGARQP